MKKYLRVDFEDDDDLIESFIGSAQRKIQDILRCDDMTEFENDNSVRVAVMFVVAFLYEHREEADHEELNLTLRAMLSDLRGVDF
nr:MAG TPA: head tail connector [Caudoviricetes sp.]